MKAERTIRRELAALRAVRDLHGDIAADHCYGASEALRWVLGEAPPPRGLTKPLGIERETMEARAMRLGTTP